MNYRGKKVAIVGYSVEGRSSYAYLESKGADLTVCDANTEVALPEGAESRLGDDYLANLDDFDLVVRTPGVLPTQIKTSTPVTTNMDLFLGACQGLVIGVTGTKGKGTVTTLIRHILKVDGQDVYIGGNVGVPPLDFVDKLTAKSITVLEMSNLQLWDITHSPQVAVLLHLAPEHLDWHSSVEQYYQTKANITKFQGPENTLVYNASNSVASDIAKRSKARKLPYPSASGAHLKKDQIYMGSTPVIAIADVPILGRHNHYNVCAAITAVWELVSSQGSVAKALASYRGLPHRLELVGEKSGVKYYDDSIATHQDATVAAIRTFSQPKVLILGGSDKGTDFDLLVKELVSNNQSVRSIILIGQMALKIKQALLAAGFDGTKLQEGVTDMAAAVAEASKQAESGDVVLLSPACASFDMFASYADRGDQFKAAVQRLP